jgi:sulfane dehydrogenase subunit SoxC
VRWHRVRTPVPALGFGVTHEASGALSGRELLHSNLEEAGLLDNVVVELLFTGHDQGIDQYVAQNYERSLPLEEVLRDEVILAYRINGWTLPPQHSSPLRLVVPKYYGMTLVKRLKSITAISEPFEGSSRWSYIQQVVLYHYQQSEENSGTAVICENPHAFMMPSGIPDYLSHARHMRVRWTLVKGRA